MHDSKDEEAQISEIWPPPPIRNRKFHPVWVAETGSRFTGLFALCLSVAGFVCLAIGNSGPSTEGLSGLAFINAFEADENLMGWLMLALPLFLLGFLTGLFYWRSWNGKIAIVLALLPGLWLFVHR